MHLRPFWCGTPFVKVKEKLKEQQNKALLKKVAISRDLRNTVLSHVPLIIY